MGGSGIVFMLRNLNLFQAVGEPPEAKANVEKQEQLAKPPSPPPPQPPDAIEKVKEDTAKPNPEDDQVCHPSFKRLIACCCK